MRYYHRTQGGIRVIRMAFVGVGIGSPWPEVEEGMVRWDDSMTGASKML